MRAFLLVLLLYPIAELASLIYLADAIGSGWTFAWILATVLLGIGMMRNGKLGSLLTLGSVMREREVSLFSLLWPLRIVLAGLLFAIPGLISDVLAIVLLLPFKGPSLKTPDPRQGFQPQQQSPQDGDIIEGEYQRVDKTVDPDSRLH